MKCIRRPTARPRFVGEEVKEKKRNYYSNVPMTLIMIDSSCKDRLWTRNTRQNDKSEKKGLQSGDKYVTIKHMRNTRPISWIKAARRDFEEFPEGVQGDILSALTIAAEGSKSDKAKPFKGVDGGVF